MATLKLPLSGDVMQSIWTAFLSPFNNKIGFINIDMGRSTAPEVEEEVLAEVGSYGKQLGRISDALTVLLAHFHPREPLTQDEQDAIAALRIMLNEIADIKSRHKRPIMRLNRLSLPSA